eukprot:TRINITY_DN6813_c0_g1_i3.p1 TRINITY_DN6813_c0_g1~~TRINITY_DN6813_c0_g1_i3.p1  ORF type:complete len:202 (-),score=21.76 TRINITY_DN6813_c0_g1_i3:48-653(-)
MLADYQMEKIAQIQNALAATMSIDMVTRNHDSTLEWLRNHHLLPGTPNCCGNDMKLYVRETKIDIYYWYCLTCKKSFNIRGKSFLANYRRIPLMVLTRIIFHYFANGMNANKAMEMLKSEANYDLGYTTIKKIYMDVRLKILTYYDVLWSSGKMGNQNAVEIDESLFSHLKLKYKGEIISGEEEIKEDDKEEQKEVKRNHG